MRRLAFLLLLAAAASAQAQQMYRWTDKDGKTHYGQTPPPGVTARPVKDAMSTVAPQTPIAPSTAQSRSGLKDGEQKIDRDKAPKHY